MGGGMTRYGVKTKGKVVWILADDVKVEQGVLLFYRKTTNSPESKDADSSNVSNVSNVSNGLDVVAGFNVAAIDHFGRPDAFAKEPSVDPAPTGN